MVLLHGSLTVSIRAARNLPNVDTAARKVGFSPISNLIGHGERLLGRDWDKTDPYATVDLGDVRLARTRVLLDKLDPVWDEEFHIQTAHDVRDVVITVKGNHKIGAEDIGRAFIPASQILYGGTVEGWFDLKNNDLQPVFGDNGETAQVQAALSFLSVERDSSLGERGTFTGVKNTYFPMRKGCRVTLYQDAHLHSLPDVYLQEGSVYQHSKLWEDIHLAISQAQHCIYIAGWSVFPEIRLTRDPHGRFGVSPTLGELLKQKAEEGVQVLMLVWDDKTSINNRVLQRDGVMATHDEDTARFFNGSKVHCFLCPREADRDMSIVKGVTTGTYFTHHQKLVVCDTPGVSPSGEGAYGGPQEGGLRRLLAFVGGIDLCDGRYDWQDHTLFKSLGPNGPHSDDFHQPCLTKASVDLGGPREPWHDIHSRVEGPIAWDVAWNFEQRWRKQAPARLHNCLVHSQDLPELPGPHMDWTGPGDRNFFLNDESDPSCWNVQLFRSIDTGAAALFPSDPLEVNAQGLISGKDVTIERSIQTAYVTAIRRAQHFIYIENQYFLGSSFGWPTDQKSGCYHLIPIELALKICSKIKGGERFAVYVVIPLYPEGIPDSGSVMQILHYQLQTIRMMYRMIADALQEAGKVDEHPRDYLNFFCLGNRELPGPGEQLKASLKGPNTPYARSQRNRRFMVYVHSKMIIVDDELIILGSANINQRSMDGGRDSEIAVGSYQPAHTLASRGGQLPRGDVHGFRMSLWAEHTGVLTDSFLKPDTLECVQDMYRMGWHNWEEFSGDEVVDMRGHLMAYPLQVGKDGSVGSLPGCVNIPDTDAPVVGKTTSLPSDLTT